MRFDKTTSHLQSVAYISMNRPRKAEASSNSAKKLAVEKDYCGLPKTGLEIRNEVGLNSAIHGGSLH